jgi:hypothetical protein
VVALDHSRAAHSLGVGRGNGSSPAYSDEIHYIAQARSLAEGKGYVDESGRPTAYWR